MNQIFKKLPDDTLPFLLWTTPLAKSWVPASLNLLYTVRYGPLICFKI